MCTYVTRHLFPNQILVSMLQCRICEHTKCASMPPCMLQNAGCNGQDLPCVPVPVVATVLAAIFCSLSALLASVLDRVAFGNLLAIPWHDFLEITFFFFIQRVLLHYRSHLPALAYAPACQTIFLDRCFPKTFSVIKFTAASIR